MLAIKGIPSSIAVVLPLFLSFGALAQEASWLVKTPSRKPPALYVHSIVGDEARGEVLLFGGNNYGGASNETWIWDGASWSQKFPVTSPPARMGHAALAPWADTNS